MEEQLMPKPKCKSRKQIGCVDSSDLTQFKDAIRYQAGKSMAQLVNDFEHEHGLKEYGYYYYSIELREGSGA